MHEVLPFGFVGGAARKRHLEHRKGGPPCCSDKRKRPCHYLRARPPLLLDRCVIP